MHLNEQRAKETQPFHANGMSLIESATLSRLININIFISAMTSAQYFVCLVNAWKCSMWK